MLKIQKTMFIAAFCLLSAGFVTAMVVLADIGLVSPVGAMIAAPSFVVGFGLVLLLIAKLTKCYVSPYMAGLWLEEAIKKAENGRFQEAHIRAKKFAQLVPCERCGDMLDRVDQMDDATFVATLYRAREAYSVSEEHNRRRNRFVVYVCVAIAVYAFALLLRLLLQIVSS